MKQPRHTAYHSYSFAVQAIASADLIHAMQAITLSGNIETAHNVYNLPSIE